jgi:hypothetical protein
MLLFVTMVSHCLRLFFWEIRRRSEPYASLLRSCQHAEALFSCVKQFTENITSNLSMLTKHDLIIKLVIQTDWKS